MVLSLPPESLACRLDRSLATPLTWYVEPYPPAVTLLKPVGQSITNLLSKRDGPVTINNNDKKNDHQARGPDSVIKVSADSKLKTKVLDHDVHTNGMCVDVLVGGKTRKECKATQNNVGGLAPSISERITDKIKQHPPQKPSQPKPKPQAPPQGQKPACHWDNEMRQMQIKIDTVLLENKRLQKDILGYKHTIVDYEHTIATYESKVSTPRHPDCDSG